MKTIPVKRVPKKPQRPSGLILFFLFLFTLAGGAGIGLLYFQEPESAPLSAQAPLLVTAEALGAIPDAADSSSYPFLALAADEILKPAESPDALQQRQSLREPFDGALTRILAILSYKELSGRERWERAALFLTRLPYSKLEQIDLNLAVQLRSAAEKAASQLAQEKIAEILERHQRIGSGPLQRTDQLIAGLRAVQGEIAPVAPLLKNTEENGGVLSNLNDIIQFLSERSSAEISVERDAYTDRERGAYTLRLEIVPLPGFSGQRPEELSFLEGERRIGPFPVPSGEQVLDLPIRDGLSLSIAETGETVSFPRPEERTLAALGFPALCESNAPREIACPETGVAVRLFQTYRLPNLLFDAAARAAAGSGAPRPGSAVGD